MVPALVTSTRTCPAAVPSRTHFDRTIGVTVPQRVANQIRGDLGQAVGVPLPGNVAVGSDDDAAIRENRPVLLDYPLDQRPEVSGLALERDAAGQPRPREIEDVVDHPRPCAWRSRPSSRRWSGPRASSALELQQTRAGQDRVERVSQVVAEHGGEHLVQPQRLGAVVELARQLLLLPVELEEHVRLVAQDVRLDRLVEEVDGAESRSP